MTTKATSSAKGRRNEKIRQLNAHPDLRTPADEPVSTSTDHLQPMTQDIMIHRNKKKVARLIAIAFGAFTLTAVAWWYLSSEFIGPGITIVMPLLAIALLVAGLVQVRSYFNNQPALIITDQGITDRSAGLGEIHIPWSDVTDIGMASAQVNTFVVLQLGDPVAFIEHLQGIRKELARGLMKQVGSPVALTANSLEVDTYQLERMLRERWMANRASSDHPGF